MLDLAIHADADLGPVSLAHISERQGISISYLEQLFAKLRRHKLVMSVRGPGGGYQLNHSATDINVSDVIDAVDETVDATRCHGEGGCQGGELCLTHELWQDLSDQIHAFLKGISLADLIAREQVQVVASRQERYQKEGIQAVVMGKTITVSNIA